MVSNSRDLEWLEQQDIDCLWKKGKLHNRHGHPGQLNARHPTSCGACGGLASVLQNPYTEQCLTWETIDTQLYMKLRIQRRDIRFHGTRKKQTLHEALNLEHWTGYKNVLLKLRTFI